jgi:hypothetical protein
LEGPILLEFNAVNKYEMTVVGQAFSPANSRVSVDSECAACRNVGQTFRTRSSRDEISHIRAK